MGLAFLEESCVLDVPVTCVGCGFIGCPVYFVLRAPMSDFATEHTSDNVRFMEPSFKDSIENVCV